MADPRGVGEALPTHRLDVPEPAVLPFAIGSFDAIGPLSRAGFAHRHRFHEIVEVTGGTGSHMIDFVEHPIRPPNLCVIVPGQVHSWARASDLSGQVILFTDEFFADRPADREALQELGRRPWLSPGPADAGRIAATVAELSYEFAARDTGFPGALRALLHLLIVRAGRVAGAAPPAAADRAAVLSRAFTRMLAGPDPTWRTTAGYATRLGVSVGHLTDAVRRTTGATPATLVRRARALEARRLLACSDLTAGRIAARLGFADAAYFCRFFRRETGTSPGAFRAAARKNHNDLRIPSIDRAG